MRCREREPRELEMERDEGKASKEVAQEAQERQRPSIISKRAFSNSFSETSCSKAAGGPKPRRFSFFFLLFVHTSFNDHNLNFETLKTSFIVKRVGRL